MTEGAASRRSRRIVATPPSIEYSTKTMSKASGGRGRTHGQFNIEFCYDSEHERLGIVEINPRMASQFADLYEKVDGFNSYCLLLDLALGRRPTLRHRAGRHAAAASCVLRRFEDALVVKGPPHDELESIIQVHADVRIEVLASAGERLSQQLQDGCSFRYGMVSVGGRSREDVLTVFDWCRQRAHSGPGDERESVRLSANRRDQPPEGNCHALSAIADRAAFASGATSMMIHRRKASRLTSFGRCE